MWRFNIVIPFYRHGHTMIGKLENQILHEFFIGGGQLKISIRSGNSVTVPDFWYDIYSDQERAKRREFVLSSAAALATLPFENPLNVAETLSVSYRDVLYLIRMQKLGTVKIGKYLNIYPPSIDNYIQKSLSEFTCPIF